MDMLSAVMGNIGVTPAGCNCPYCRQSQGGYAAWGMAQAQFQQTYGTPEQQAASRERRSKIESDTSSDGTLTVYRKYGIVAKVLSQMNLVRHD
jgi:hypothetical protein